MDPAQHRPEVLPSSAPASEPRDERPSHDAIWGWHFLHDSGVLGSTAIRSSAREAAEIAGTLAAWEAVRVAEEAPSWKAARSAALLCGTNRSDFLACFIEGSPLRGHKLGVSAARQWVGGDHPGVRVPSS